MRIKHLFSRFGSIRFFADGDGDGDGGGGGGGGDGTPDWHSDFPCLVNNPKASEAVAKYKDPNAAMEAFAVDAQKKLGRAYWLPDDHSKLTDEQKNEIRANVAKMNNVPETADGYKLKVKEGTKAAIDDLGMAELKVFCKENKIPNELAQSLLDFQAAFTDRVSSAFLATEKQAIKDRNVKISKQFVTDCGGEPQAVLRREMIKGLLQSKCKNAEGNPDPEMWEAFEKQYDEKGIDLPLLRALAEPALAASEAGTLPAGGGKTQTVVTGDYAEMG